MSSFVKAIKIDLKSGFILFINVSCYKFDKFNNLNTLYRHPQSVFYKNNHLYDLGLNYTKLDDPLEVIQKIKELEKVLRPFFRKLLKIASLVATKITTEVFSVFP